MRTLIFFPILFLALLSSTEVQGQTAAWSRFDSSGFAPHYGETATLLNGKVYVIGGESTDGVFLNSIQVYDIASDSWSNVSPSGYFNIHFGHSAVAANGKIYILGGGIDYQGGLTDTISVYDPVGNSWTMMDPGEGTTMTPRYDFACSIIGDSIYTIGGELGSYWFSSALEVYNITTSKWSVPSTTIDSFHYMLTPLSFAVNGKIYIVGDPRDTSCHHCEVEIYDPQKNSWTIPRTNGMSIRRGFFGAAEYNGKIYVMGGVNLNKGGVDDSTSEVYDIQTQTWSPLTVKGSMSQRSYFPAVVNANRIYTFGGQYIQSRLNSTEVLTIGASGVFDGKVGYEHRVFPIPAKNTLNLVSLESPAKYQIIDVLGTVVLHGMTLDHATLPIDISSLPQGVYYVLVNNPWGSPVNAGKFVVQK